ncbi:MAG TPA: amidohydrolase [Bacteroidia bacterium]|nr:amidohydrolase [Bacteroidia bacterium]
MKIITRIFPLFFLLLFACKGKKQKADFILRNGKVYTADASFDVLESFAVKDGKIIAVGTNESIGAMFESDSILDAKGKTVLPGLIDAHCHFVGYSLGLQQCDLVGTTSFDDVIKRVQDFAKTNKNEWIIGRGWDQNDWAVKEFPDRKMLDSLFPHTPVLLKRVDGHAALVNGEALRRANITDSTGVEGGEIIREIAGVQKSGRHTTVIVYGAPTGILIDNAVNLVEKVIPPANETQMRDALLQGQENCFADGLTTLDDAGLMKWQIDIIDQLQKKGELKMRIYAMLSDSLPNYEHYLSFGPYKTDYLDVRAFKFYADGALGSRGACLLKPYTDKPGWQGFLLNSPAHFATRMKKALDAGFQVCTHCIGDSANRFILHLYDSLLPDSARRWRIEHAQVVSKEDVPLFAHRLIIPSVQPTHATSDMYWAGKRLGDDRMKTAYAYNDLLSSAGILALGTDFPVENINPMYTFYAAVSRMDLQHFPQGGFQPENALSRRNTLLGMTAWAAWANFEEREKGSIGAGKFADFVILDNDPMTCAVEEIPLIHVLDTYVGGKKVFERK